MSKNISLYVGGNAENQLYTSGSKRADNHREKKADTIFAGDADFNNDPIAQKRKEAQKRAMRVVGDAFAAEQEIDHDIKERREHIRTLNEEMGTAITALNQIEADKNDMREAYGIKEDSREHQDLLLIEKRNDSLRRGSSVTLTEEDMERLQEIDKEERTEYQSRALQMDSYGAPYRITIEETQGQISQESAIIRGVKQERLKSHTIIDAQKEADAIKDAASDEIVGMLVEEAKDHVDKEMQDNKDAANEKAEKDAEQEEQLEAIREKKEQMEELADPNQKKEQEEQTSADVPTQNMVQLSQIKTDVQTEVENIVQKMKLVAEDIKGAQVDTKA